MLTEAQRFTRQMALSHYENFVVGGLLTPRTVRQDFYNIYAYCRAADDLADEIDNPSESLQRLDQWERWLEDCYANRPPGHPIFAALRETIDRFAIPIDPFRNLLVAFRSDQQPQTYSSFDSLLTYCRYSANPVGHLVLYLGECFNEKNARLADFICTGLQLANFWQDIHRDFAKGRCYVPTEVLDQFGVSRDALGQRQAPLNGPEMIAHLVHQTRGYFASGLPLVHEVPKWLSRDVRLFAGGGEAILNAISKQNFDVWRQRPIVPRWKQLWLMTTIALGCCSRATQHTTSAQRLTPAPSSNLPK